MKRKFFTFIFFNELKVRLFHSELMIIKIVVLLYLILALVSTGLATEEKNKAEYVAITTAQKALSTAIEDSAVITIASGLLLFATIAIVSGSEDQPTAHGYGH